MKFFASIIAGIIVGGFGVYFTLDWQEEKIEYSITEPAKFGEIIYQNISISNKGWNPGINVKIYINHPEISFSNIQSSSSLNNLSNEKDGIAIIERIRKSEQLLLSIAYKGNPLNINEIKITSDRSIAKLVSNEFQYKIPLWVMCVMIAVVAILGVMLGIFLSGFFHERLMDRIHNKEKRNN